MSEKTHEEIVTSALALPQEMFRQATDVASVCREIVAASAIEIDRRKYVRVEGWMAIAVAHGCVASSGEVEEIATGVRAIAEIRRLRDGVVICRAEGFVGNDEPLWFGGPDKAWDKLNRCWKDVVREKRADYAIRAMAQTRAVSRACRTAFAHVIVMMDAGLQTTPAEEIHQSGFTETETERPAAERVNSAPVEKKVEVPREINIDLRKRFEGGKWADVKIHFGKNNGVRLGDLPENTLSWYANEWQPRPFRGEIGEDDQFLRAALDAQLLEKK